MPSRKTIFIILLLATSVFIYAQSFNNDFVWDSNDAICSDSTIRDIRNIPGFFTKYYHDTADQEGMTKINIPYYRPLLKTYRTLEYTFFGTNPIGYNAMNILLNALVVLVAFNLLYKMTGNINTAFLASLLFAVNPTHVEAVSWVISDCYILVALLSLLSLLYYHHGKYFTALAIFSPALFIHEQAIHFPVVLAVYELTMRGKTELRNILKAAPFVGVTVLYLCARLFFTKSMPPTSTPLQSPFSTAVVVIQRHIKIFFAPDALITVYEKKSFPFMSGESIFSLGLLAVLLVAALWLYRKQQFIPMFWYSWFFVWIALPVITTMTNHLGEFLMADKSIYISSLGFCTLIAYCAVSAPGWSKRAVYVAVAALVIFHATYTVARTTYWKSEMVYFKKAYEFAPDYYNINRMLGRLYANNRQYDEALFFLERTVALNTRDSQAFSDLGNILFLKGLTQRAKIAWENAVAADSANPIPYYNLGMLAENERDIGAAILMYKKYLGLAKNVPDEIRAHIYGLEKVK